MIFIYYYVLMSMNRRHYLVLLSMLIQTRHHSDLVKVELVGIKNMLDQKIV